MAAGDHLQVFRGAYWHHAIDLGNGSVVQYSGEPFRKGESRIGAVPMAEFLKGGTASIVAYESCDPVEIVLARAISRLGELNYSIPSNNCEHFARWCKTGIEESGQVRAYALAGSAIAGLIARGLIGRVAAGWLIPGAGAVLTTAFVGYVAFKWIRIARWARPAADGGARLSCEAACGSC